MSDEKKIFDKLTGAVIFNQLALNFNEELKHTKFYKKPLKNPLIKAIRQLMVAEKNEFERLFEADAEYTDVVSANVLNIIETISKGSFADLIIIGNIIVAQQKNPKAIEGIVKKILNNEQ